MEQEDTHTPEESSPTAARQLPDPSSPTSPRDDTQFQRYFLQPHPAPLMPPPFLRSLKPEDVISFLHSFHNADAAVRISGGQPLSIQPYIDGRVIRKLKEAKGYSTSAETLKELNNIVEDYDRSKKKMLYTSWTANSLGI
eukprot:snap_masked-scaffold_64-processed-gene-0.35-mRNA-1 protein AED:1.00 eAED:1.00 QI:0/-1/0/0/-1/1/1/0/139